MIFIRYKLLVGSNLKKQISFIIISLSIGLFSCRNSGSARSSNVDSSKLSLDSIIYKNYIEAIDNESTFQFFLVAKIKDLNTGQIKRDLYKGRFSGRCATYGI